jgi:hypothetical protein
MSIIIKNRGERILHLCLPIFSWQKVRGKDTEIIPKYDELKPSLVDPRAHQRSNKKVTKFNNTDKRMKREEGTLELQVGIKILMSEDEIKK